MIENRRIRFACIDGIDRRDLPLAGEVWLDDLKQQIWVTREIIKLGTLFTSYMSNPDREAVSMSNIEGTCKLDRNQTDDSLRLMQVYGVILDYGCKGDELTASLNLTLLQRLKVLEARERFGELVGKPRPFNLPLQPRLTDRWRSSSASPLVDEAAARPKPAAKAGR